jgi:uncharacterized iron-regulated protein
MTQAAPIFLLGDTEHANAAIKRDIAAMLPELKAKGYSTLAVEIDQSKQPLMDALASSEADVTSYAREMLGIKNAEGMGALLQTALQNNMRIVCIDSKENTQALDKTYPEFREIRRACNAIYHAMGDVAEQAALDAFQVEELERYKKYIEAYRAWKAARTEMDGVMAARLITLAGDGEKVVAVIGQSHLARPRGIPSLLCDAGIATEHMDVYASRRDYDAFMQRSFELDENKQVPPFIRVVDDGVTLAIRDASPAVQIVSVKKHMPPPTLIQFEVRA